MTNKIKKVILLGSGALKIGEAGEFDYSGSQALKALKEEKIKTVLVNPNIATFQTSKNMADEVYFLPITDYFVEKIIAKEKPDGILLSFGGQTALNCGLSLEKKGILKKYRVKVLGTPTSAIMLTEDRQMFADHLKTLNIPVPKSSAATNLNQALSIAKKIGYPLMVRAAFALGGQKSGVARNQKQLEELVQGALAISPQVLVEQYLHHYKEVEYEVVRDCFDNCVTVCNMENFDPLGIHTGDSIVVAPSQTLNNYEYHTLRKASTKIVKSLGIIGECNVQYALNPKLVNGKIDFRVIEVNARLSRSSALASKATGYPLAYVAAKLALGKSLDQVQNLVTKSTQSFFEPAMDYLVVKFPRWDLEKFKGAEEKIGSAMKSVGEVMAIGRSFEEALQKAVRMQSGNVESVTDNGLPESLKELKVYLTQATPKRLYAVAAALNKGMTVGAIHKLTGIDPWFLHRIKNIVVAEKEFRKNITSPSLSFKKEGEGPILPLSKGRLGGVINHVDLLHLKQLGFSDKKIGQLCGKSELEIRKIRKDLGIKPAIFQVDTLAGEAPAKTNYLYLTYLGNHMDAKPIGKNGVMVLGSGPYHIGSSVEFDWSAVNTALALKKYGRKSIIINCNPETVSTDYDMSDRLYFENISFETVADIYEYEKPEGVIVSVGGQRPNNLAKKLSKAGFKLLGTSAENIDRAEDRNKFSAMLDRLKILQPQWQSFSNLSEAEKFAGKVGFPVLVRPSYVLSGSAMSVCYNSRELLDFAGKAAILGSEHPVTISKFVENAKELEFDAVAQNGRVIIYAISEHVENAGVHSGDATIVYPTQRVYASTEYQLQEISKKIAKELKVTGPFNIQFLVKDNIPYVIEVNLRASRTFPLLSKALDVNLPAMAVDAFYGKAKKYQFEYPSLVVVKSPQFSFARLSGADPILRVEMSSTGEVAAFGASYDEALIKSVLSANSFEFSKKSVLLSLGGQMNKIKFLEAAQILRDLNYQIFATDTTAEFLTQQGVACQVVSKASEVGNKKTKLNKISNFLEVLQNKQVAFVVNLSQRGVKTDENTAVRHLTDGFKIRRASVDNQVPLFTDLHLARAFIKALKHLGLKDLEIKSYREYLAN